MLTLRILIAYLHNSLLLFLVSLEIVIFFLQIAWQFKSIEAHCSLYLLQGYFPSIFWTDTRLCSTFVQQINIGFVSSNLFSLPLGHIGLVRTFASMIKIKINFSSFKTDLRDLHIYNSHIITRSSNKSAYNYVVKNFLFYLHFFFYKIYI